MYELLGNPTTLLIEPPGPLNFKHAVMICKSPYRKTQASNLKKRGCLYKLFELVSWWLLFNANSANFQLCHGGNKLIFNEMMTRSALY